MSRFLFSNVKIPALSPNRRNSYRFYRPLILGTHGEFVHIFLKTISKILHQSVIKEDMELDAQMCVARTVLELTKLVTDSMGPVMKAVLQDTEDLSVTWVGNLFRLAL